MIDPTTQLSMLLGIVHNHAPVKLLKRTLAQQFDTTISCPQIEPVVTPVDGHISKNAPSEATGKVENAMVMVNQKIIVLKVILWKNHLQPCGNRVTVESV